MNARYSYGNAVRFKPSGHVHLVDAVEPRSRQTFADFDWVHMVCGAARSSSEITLDFPRDIPRCERCALAMRKRHQTVFDPTDQSLAMSSLHTALGTEPATLHTAPAADQSTEAAPVELVTFSQSVTAQQLRDAAFDLRQETERAVTNVLRAHVVEMGGAVVGRPRLTWTCRVEADVETHS